VNLALINPKVWLELAIAAVLAGLCWWGYGVVYDRGAANVQMKWDAERAQIEAQSAKVAADALATTKTLAATIETQRSNSNAQIASLNQSLSVAVAGLSNRPSRGGEGGVPINTAPGAGCYPAALYREDAAVALKLAGEADKLRVLLGQCQAAYNAARQALN
jgi:hypothetical protein